MKIVSLVPGGAGFIGSHLCDQLIGNGQSVICYDNLSLGKKENIAHLLDHPNFIFIKGDILDRDSFQSTFKTYTIDTLFHMAANSDIQAGSEHIDRDCDLTFRTTVECLEAAKKFGVKSFVFASSSAVYGRFSESMSEISGPLRPVSFYGAAKLASENYIHAMLEQTDMKAWVIRFPNVIGERLTHGVIYDFMNKLKANPTQLEILGDGNQTKPYVYVKDLVAGILFSYKTLQDRFNIINLGVDSATSVTEIAEIVVKEMGLTNVSLHYTGGEEGWVGDVPRFQYDLTKITQLGWQASMTSNEAVRHSIQQEQRLQHQS